MTLTRGCLVWGHWLFAYPQKILGLQVVPNTNGARDKQARPPCTRNIARRTTLFFFFFFFFPPPPPPPPPPPKKKNFFFYVTVAVVFDVSLRSPGAVLFRSHLGVTGQRPLPLPPWDLLPLIEPRALAPSQVSQTLFSSAFKQSNRAMLLVDGNRTIINANGAHLRLYGYQTRQDHRPARSTSSSSGGRPSPRRSGISPPLRRSVHGRDEAPVRGRLAGRGAMGRDNRAHDRAVPRPICRAGDFALGRPVPPDGAAQAPSPASCPPRDSRSSGRLPSAAPAPDRRRTPDLTSHGQNPRSQRDVEGRRPFAGPPGRQDAGRRDRSALRRGERPPLSRAGYWFCAASVGQAAHRTADSSASASCLLRSSMSWTADRPGHLELTLI